MIKQLISQVIFASFMRVLTCIKLSFSSAHTLTKDLGTQACSTIHGHNYTVELCFTSENPLPWVYDFKRLKVIAKKVIDQLDHKLLLPEKICKSSNVSIPGTDPSIICLPVEEVTAEELALYIAKEVTNVINNEQIKISLVKVRLYESDTSYVEVELL